MARRAESANRAVAATDGGKALSMRTSPLLSALALSTVAALTGEAGGFAASDIGKIEIHDNFSYVAIDRSVSEAARKSLSTGRIKGKKFIVTLEK